MKVDIYCKNCQTLLKSITHLESPEDLLVDMLMCPTCLQQQIDTSYAEGYVAGQESRS